MVAVPLVPVIQRNHEHISLLKGPEGGCAVRLAGNGVAQLTVQTFENGGTVEKVTDSCGLALQDLLHEVVDYVAVVAGEGQLPF
jgi:hypothetical protein